MDEFAADQWLPFNIDKAHYELFLEYVTRTAKGLTLDPDDQADIRGKMWLKCLEIRSTPPKNYPTDTNEQVLYCQAAMHHAGLRCLKRDLPDGPTIRPNGYVDPDRMTTSLPDPE